MRKRVIEAGVGLLGLIVIALAVASATLWRADDVLVARATVTAGLVVTDPGVLELGGDPVTIRAQVPAGARVVLAVGRDTDVAGWVGSDPHQRVSGLTSWHALRLVAPAATTSPTSTAPVAAPATGSASTVPAPAAATGSATPAASASVAAPATATSAASAPGATGGPGAARAADPTGSDMWIAQATGTGSAQLVWHARDGRWSLLVAGIAADGSAVAPTLELSWPRIVSTPWLAPGLVVGSLLLVAGLGLLGRDWWRGRTGRDGWTSVETGALPQVVPSGSAPALTRRQLRELQSRSGRPPTGAIPSVPMVDLPPVAGADRGRPAGRALPPTEARGSTGDRPAPVPSSSGRASGVPAAGPARQVPPAPAPAPARSGSSAGRPAIPAGQAEQAAAEAASSSVAAPHGPAATPWTAGGRRARRAAPQSDTSGTTSAPAEQGSVPAHEGRPTWAPTAAGSARADGPSGAASTGPRDPRSASGAAGRAPSEPPTSQPPTSASAPRRAQPPRPAGWVPIPDAGPRPPASSDRRAAADGRSDPRAAPASHPSWLAPGPEHPPRPVPGAPTRSLPVPGTDATTSSGRSEGSSDEADETLSSRADAWRRAWGLPTEPPADDHGEEGR